MICIFQFLATWQCDIHDPSASQFKRDMLEEAFLRFEKWVDRRKQCIKEIDEELYSQVAKVERIGKYSQGTHWPVG